MDEFSRHYFGLVFGSRFSNAYGNEFQNFFGTIMNMRYPGDFVQTKPWGALGDNKCDGYLASMRKYYQCYGPVRIKKSETLEKIKEDFYGALPYREYFNFWVFVHNFPGGCLPTWCIQELQTIQSENQPVKVETIGYIELREEALKLEPHQLVDLFGRFVSLSDVLSVTFEDLRPLIGYIAKKDAVADFPPNPIPKEKMKFNPS